MYPVIPGHVVRVTGIAAKGETLSGDLRAVMVARTYDLARIPLPGEVIEKGLFPPVVVALDGTGNYGPQTIGTQTSGIQEAINYCVSSGRDLYIRGEGVYHISQTLRIPPARRFTIESGNYVIDWSGNQNTTDDTIRIDSAKDCHYRLGLIVGAENGSGAVVRVRPQNPIPYENITGFTESELRLECSTGKFPFSAGDRQGVGVMFDTTYGPITNSDFFFIAVMNLLTQIWCPDGGYPFACNRVERGHLHTNAHNSTLLRLGANSYQNYFRIAQGVDQGATGVTGIDIYGSNNVLDISSRHGFPANRELIFEDSAAGNCVTYMHGGDNPLSLITDLAANPTNELNWTGSTAPIVTLTAGASPYIYTQRLYPAVVRVQGGSVSRIIHQRGGATVDYGSARSDIYMSVGDRLEITHSAAPTLQIIPM